MTDKKTAVQEPQQQQQAASGQSVPSQAREQTGLNHRYGSIGIEAVAAAVRYSNPGKKAAEPTSAPRIDQRFEQMG